MLLRCEVWGWFGREIEAGSSCLGSCLGFCPEWRHEVATASLPGRLLRDCEEGRLRERGRKPEDFAGAWGDVSPLHDEDRMECGGRRDAMPTSTLV